MRLKNIFNNIVNYNISNIYRQNSKNEENDVHYQILMTMKICCRFMKNNLNCFIRIIFMCEINDVFEFKILKSFLIELIIKLSLRNDVIFDNHVIRNHVWIVITNRICFFRFLKLNDFEIRNITHYFENNVDCVEKLQKFFRIFDKIIIYEKLQ